MLVHLCIDYCTDFLSLEIADYDTEAGGEGSWFWWWQWFFIHQTSEVLFIVCVCYFNCYAACQKQN